MFLGEGNHPPARYSGANLFSLEVEVRLHGGFDAKRLRELEPENAKLKKLLAEQMRTTRR